MNAHPARGCGYFLTAFFLRSAQSVMRSDTAFLSSADIFRRFLSGLTSDLLSAAAVAFLERGDLERAGGVADALRIYSASVNGPRPERQSRRSKSNGGAAARSARPWPRRRHDWPPARRRRRLTISTPSAFAAARIMSASGTAPAVSRGAPDGPAGAGPAIGRRSSPPDVSDRDHSTRYTRSEYCSSLTRSGAPGAAAPHRSAPSRSACRWHTSPRVSRSPGRRRAVDTPHVMTPARPPRYASPRGQRRPQLL